MIAMDVDDLVHLRLLKLGLSAPDGTDPAAVVSRLGAVQSQDYGPAKWSLGQRVPGLDDAAVDAAFDAGHLLRTHVLRPTWHFVAPRDLRWLLALTAPRVHQLSAYYYRQLGLDADVRTRAQAVIADTLADGGPRTRADLLAALAAADVPTAGAAGAYAVMCAELDGVVVSGPRIGKQHTYQLLEARVPPAPDAEAALAADREAALTELAHRFFASHGPATVQDFRAWSSLTVSDIRRALEGLADRLERVEVGGRTFWFEPPADPRPAPSPAVHLLQAYDEYLVGHAESKDLITLDGTRTGVWGDRSTFNAVVVLDGTVVGRWRRTVARDRLAVDVQAARDFDGAAHGALVAAAEAHGRFLGAATTEVTVTPLG
jgi:hypothetical protein